MALANCILGKFLGVGCHCFPPLLDVSTFSARCLHVQRRERPLAAEGGTLRGREMFRQISSRIRLPRNCRDILHAANLQHGTDGFTSPPKEGVLKIFWYMIYDDIYDIWYDMVWYDMIWYDMIWYDMTWYDMIWYMIWYDMIYDMIWYGMIWYMIWYDMIYDMMIWYMIYDIWYMIYDMIYDMMWYDMIWYMKWHDIFVNCNWVDTRWQQYSTHIHTNNTQNNTIDTNNT